MYMKNEMKEVVYEIKKVKEVDEYSFTEFEVDLSSIKRSSLKNNQKEFNRRGIKLEMIMELNIHQSISGKCLIMCHLKLFMRIQGIIRKI